MRNSIIVVVIIICLSGCKGDPGPAGPAISGDIVGKIALYGDNGLPLENRSGAQVSIEGSSFSSLTATDGSWKLAGVPGGIYTLVFSKAGFMSGKYFNFQFVGNGTYYFSGSYIAQIPLVTVTQLKFVPFDTTINFKILGKISSADSLQRNIGIIFDKKPIVISATMTYLFYTDIAAPPDSTSFLSYYGFHDYQKKEYELSSGTKLYIRAFVFPRTGFYGNHNPATGANEIYNSGIAFTSLDSVIVP